MGHKYTMLKDKPYGFVPLVNTIPPQQSLQKHIPHNSINNGNYSGKLSLIIKAITDIHLGSSSFDFSNGEPYKAFMRKGDDLIIAGSSLKGVVRSIAEAVSFSCAPLSYPKDVEYALGANKYHCNTENLCITCSMFGMQSKKVVYKGKIDFRDFKLQKDNRKLKINNIPQLDRPFTNYPDKNKKNSKYTYSCFGNPRLYYCKACNDDCQNCKRDDFINKIKSVPFVSLNNEPYKNFKYKLNGKNIAKFRGRKFYYTDEQKLNKENVSSKEIPYEFVGKGSIFIGDIYFKNLTDDELGLLTYSLGISGDFTPKLGYGKSLGFGAVKIELEGVEDYRTRYMSVKDELTGAKINELIKGYKDKTIEVYRDIKTANNSLCNILSPLKDGD